MQIQNIQTSKIFANDYNPNVVPEKIMKQLIKDVQRNGIKQPVLVRQDGDSYVIIDGEHRWRSAKELGLASVPCEVLEVSRHEAMVLTISMNRLRGDFDSMKLAEVLKELKEEYTDDQLEDVLGYDQTELSAFTDLLDYDFSSITDKQNEDLEIEDVDAPIKLENELVLPCTFHQLHVIEKLIEVHGGQNESKTSTIVRVCSDILKAEYPEAWQEILDKKEELEAEEV